jgi:DNA (cytosine-5)-methyltransferase 1
MRHIGLFAGIGGFELAARWMGWNTIAWSEWDPFCQKVLSYHFPEAKGYGDIKQSDFTQYRGQCDILTGGFPCQPYSVAGKRLGKEDERHLWPEMLRVIREVRPRWIIGENVRGLLSWNEGVVFEEVCSDLESEGYEVQAFIIPAASVGAPHRRERVWIVAHSDNSRSGDGFGQVQTENGKISKRYDYAEPCDSNSRLTPNADSNGHDAKSAETNNSIWQDNQQSRPQRERTSEGFSDEWLTTNAESKRHECIDSRNKEFQSHTRQEIYGRGSVGYSKCKNWSDFPTISPVCGGDDGLPSELDGITLPKWRKESIKAYGNAIVPQVAYQLFQAIKNTKSLAY